MNGRARAGLLLLSAAALSAACSTTDTSSGTGGSTSTSTAGLAIKSPALGACIEVPEGPDPRIPIELELTNLVLRPPGTCMSIALRTCGHVVVKVNGLENNFGASTVVDVLLRKFGNPYDETLVIEVGALNDAGEPIITGDAGAPLSASVTVKTRASCGSGTGGGATTGTTTGTGGAGGMGGTGGAGKGG